MNYVDGKFVIDEINDLRRNGQDVTIDWLDLKFVPETEATPRILKSLEYYRDGLEGHLASHNVELSRLVELKLHCPAEARKFIEATDDRGEALQDLCT